MALIGIHMSCFFQHYEGYLYDINANKYRFSRILGKYYAIMSTSILCASFILNIQDIISYQYILSFQCFISIIATFMIFLTPNSTIKITNNSIFRVTHIIKSHTMFYILLLAIIEGLFMSSANMISILAEHYSQTVNISAKLMIVITAIKIPLNYISGRLKIKHPLIINQLAVLISLPFFYLGGEFGIIGLILYFIFYAIGTIHIYSVVHANIIPNDRMIAASVITIFISIFTICFDLNIGWLGVRNGIIANSIMSILFCHIVYKMQNHSLKNILHRVT